MASTTSAFNGRLQYSHATVTVPADAGYVLRIERSVMATTKTEALLILTSSGRLFQRFIDLRKGTVPSIATNELLIDKNKATEVATYTLSDMLVLPPWLEDDPEEHILFVGTQPSQEIWRVSTTVLFVGRIDRLDPRNFDVSVVSSYDVNVRSFRDPPRLERLYMDGKRFQVIVGNPNDYVLVPLTLSVSNPKTSTITYFRNRQSVLENANYQTMANLFAKTGLRAKWILPSAPNAATFLGHVVFVHTYHNLYRTAVWSVPTKNNPGLLEFSYARVPDKNIEPQPGVSYPFDAFMYSFPLNGSPFTSAHARYASETRAKQVVTEFVPGVLYTQNQCVITTTETLYTPPSDRLLFDVAHVDNVSRHGAFAARMTEYGTLDSAGLACWAAPPTGGLLLWSPLSDTSPLAGAIDPDSTEFVANAKNFVYRSVRSSFELTQRLQRKASPTLWTSSAPALDEDGYPTDNKTRIFLVYKVKIDTLVSPLRLSSLTHVVLHWLTHKDKAWFDEGLLADTLTVATPTSIPIELNIQTASSLSDIARVGATLIATVWAYDLPYKLNHTDQDPVGQLFAHSLQVLYHRQLVIDDDAPVNSNIQTILGKLGSLSNTEDMLERFQIEYADLNELLGVCEDQIEREDPITFEPLAMTVPRDVLFVWRDDNVGKSQAVSNNYVLQCYDKLSFAQANNTQMLQNGQRTSLEFAGVTLDFGTRTKAVEAYNKIVSSPPNSVIQLKRRASGSPPKYRLAKILPRSSEAVNLLQNDIELARQAQEEASAASSPTQPQRRRQ